MNRDADYRGLDPERVLAHRGQLYQQMGLEALRRCYMVFWLLQQEGLCHDHCIGLDTDHFRLLLHHFLIIKYARTAMILGATVQTIMGCYEDEEILWPDQRRRN